MIIDTHSHLFDEQFDSDRQECIRRAKQANIEKILLVGFSSETNRQAMEMSQKDAVFYPTAGLHPSLALSVNEQMLDEYTEWVENHRVYAIGECGLDYHYGKEDMDKQKELFRFQLELAQKKNLPVIIHMRDAQQDTFQIVRSFAGKITGVMHCYSGSWEMAREWIKLGFYISLGGPVTFKNANESKKIAQEIPLDRLLVETDCPYLAPTPYRGNRNETAYIVYVIEEIARLRGISFEEVAQKTTENAMKLFHLEG